MQFPRVRIVNGIPRIRGITVTRILEASVQGDLLGLDPEDLAEARRLALAAFDNASLPPGIAAEQKGMLKLLSTFTDPIELTSSPSPSLGLVEQVVFRDHLALIQDFSTALNNPEACFTLLAREVELEAAKRKVMGAGQRYPGLVVEVLLTNEAEPSRKKLPIPLTDFQMWRGAFVVLAHCPSRRNFERMCINAVYRHEMESLDKARASYFDRPVFTLFGCVMFVGDSEDGEVAGIAMKTGEPMAWALSG